jgi:GTP-binding protein
MARRRAGGRGFASQISAPGRAGRPIVAIVGRPNVGKSALFNRLSGAPLAIVDDTPGVTRDRLYADARAYGRDYVLVDTGGLDQESEDPLKQSIAAQVRVALSEADVVICVLDGTTEPVAADREAIDLLRRTELPVLYAANKIDNPSRSLDAKALYRLGIDQLREISALHGHGIGELEEALAEALPAAPAETELDGEQATRDRQQTTGNVMLAEDEVGEADERGAAAGPPRLPRVAIVGRPNAGKSSLVNRLLGEARQIVDDRPGTTVDSVDALCDRGGDPFVLIDTAGIRRKRAVEHGLELQAVMQAIRAVERSDTVVLMIDAAEGASQQDARIAGLAIERGRALCIVLNKVDLLRPEQRDAVLERAKDVFGFAPWAPILRISARTGQGVGAATKVVRSVTENRFKRVSTSQVNRFFEEVLAHHPPPTSGGRSVRLYYVTQVRSGPPVFMVSTNHPDRVHFSYQRYVANQLRERFGFEGTPVIVHYRAKDRRRSP